MAIDDASTSPINGASNNGFLVTLNVLVGIAIVVAVGALFWSLYHIFTKNKEAPPEESEEEEEPVEEQDNQKKKKTTKQQQQQQQKPQQQKPQQQQQQVQRNRQLKPATQEQQMRLNRSIHDESSIPGQQRLAAYIRAEEE